MTFLENRFQTLRKQQQQKENEGNRWINSLTLRIAGDCSRKAYKTVDLGLLVFRLFEFLYEIPLTDKTKAQLIKSIAKKRPLITSIFKTVEMLKINKPEFICFCYSRIKLNALNFRGAISWFFSRSVDDLMYAQRLGRINLKEINELLSQTENGKSLINEVGFKLDKVTNMKRYSFPEITQKI